MQENPAQKEIYIFAKKKKKKKNSKEKKRLQRISYTIE